MAILNRDKVFNKDKNKISFKKERNIAKGTTDPGVDYFDQ